MTQEELKSLLKYNHKENNLFMPNEIFEDFKNCITNKNHLPVAYSFSYIVTWLYRYAKYFNVGEIIDIKKIKQILGYSPTNQTLDYLFKKNGLLDQVEYFESVRDFPVSWHFTKDIDEDLSFFMSSELDEDTKSRFAAVSKRFFLKYPVKAFNRIEIDYDENGEIEEYDMPGTFYGVENTHKIDFEVFMFCMSNSAIGCAGFYLYAFLKQKNDHFKEGYDVSLENLSFETAIPYRTLNKYLGVLKNYRMIDFIHNQEFFIIGMPEGNRKANTYITRDYDFFSDIPVPYNRIEVKSEQQYAEYLEASGEFAKTIDEQMPF